MTPTDKEKTFRIGEAAELLGLETYVLRFWETEFPHLAPLRTPKGQRLYAERHMEQLRRVKFLLHEQGFTIEGARRVLEAEAVEAAEGQSSQSGPCQGFLFAPPESPRKTEALVCDSESVGQPVAAGATELPAAVVGEVVERLEDPRLRAALRCLHQELVEVRELLRAREVSSSGDRS